MNHRIYDPGFAPRDPLDGRKPGHWETRYPDKEARRAICFEAIYTGLFLFLCPLLLLAIWLKKFEPCLSLSPEQYELFCRYAFAWIGGLFGGTLHVLKWLYHSVAHWIWNRDRRLWRLLAPHLSGGLAFIFICMIDSEIILIFNREAAESTTVVLSVSFLVGYFSDNALGKMAEIAHSLFGGTVPMNSERSE